MNQLYNLFNKPNNQLGDMTNFLNAFNRFKQAFTGDSGQVIQFLLNSGQRTQEQYYYAMQFANQVQQIANIK